MQIRGSNRYLGGNSGNYATIGRAAAYSIGRGGRNPLVSGNSSYTITHRGKWLYETRARNAGFWGSDDGKTTRWRLVKVAGLCSKNDNIVRNGDVVKIYNNNWKDHYLCDFGNGRAAAGKYNKPSEWVIRIAK